MSAITSPGSTSNAFLGSIIAATHPKLNPQLSAAAPMPVAKDSDRDGDTDGSGLDVKG